MPVRRVRGMQIWCYSGVPVSSRSGACSSPLSGEEAAPLPESKNGLYGLIWLAWTISKAGWCFGSETLIQ